MYFQSGFSSWILLFLMINMNSIVVVDSTQAGVNVPIAAIWSQNATTVAGQANGSYGSSISSLDSPGGLIITSNNILYIADCNNNRVITKNLSSLAAASTIGSGPGSYSSQFNSPQDVFITNTYLYVLDDSNNRVQKWSIDGTNPSTAVQSAVFYNSAFMFIDKYNNLYVNAYINHTVQRFALNSSISVIVAGTGIAGSGSNQFNGSVGIYVDDNLTLYAIDRGNARVQMWRYGASSGTTVAGTGIAGSSLSQLSDPVGLIVDTNGYIYIADSGNNRIVRWAPNSTIGICIAACNNTYGIGSNQLNWPIALAFDSNGSLYVTDKDNNRVQKFQILASQSNVPTTIQTTSKSLVTTQVTSTVDTSSPLSTTEILTSTVFQTSSPLTTTEMLTSTISRTTTSASTTELLISSTGQTSSSLSTKEISTSTILDTSSPLSTTEILTSAVFQTSSPLTTTEMLTSTIFHTTTSASTTELLTSSTGQTSSSLSTKEISTSTILTSTTITIRSTMDSTTAPMTSVITSKSLSTLDNVETSMSSAQSTFNTKSTMKLIQTSTSQTLLTSPVSDGGHLVRTSPFTDMLSSTIQSSSVRFSSGSMLTSVTTSDQSTMMKTQSSILSSKVQVTSTTPSNIPSSTSTITELNCSTSAISLWPDNPAATTPFVIEYSKDFSISSSLRLNCFVGLAFTEQWSIEKCINSMCSTTDSVALSLPTLTSSELYIPSKTLPYGLYRMKINVTIGSLVLSAMTYIQIIPSAIQVNLIAYGPSIITQGEQQTLLLDPGTFSIDPDQTNFNSTNWNYTYFCRLYNASILPNTNETMFPMENSSCLRNSTSWKYPSTTSRSSLLIFNGSLQSNQTYHFRVQLNHVLNSSFSYSGDLLVQIGANVSVTILIKCVIEIMCVPTNEYQVINPTTQIALTSFAMENVTFNWNIQWNIYYATNNYPQWTIWPNQTQYRDNWIFGMNSSKLTVTQDLLATYSTIEYWRFEVIYSSQSLKSTGLIQFMINSPPSNGTCSISPQNGTTTTLFTIICSNWLDSNGIEDYAFYTWSEDQFNRIMLGYTTSNVFQVRIPLPNLNSSLINIIVQVKDQLACITEFTLPSISITPDLEQINSSMTIIQSSVLNSDTSDPLVQILYRGSQNDICQVLTSFSQVLNLLSQQNLQLALDNNIPLTSISISSFYQKYQLFNNQSQNSSANLTAFNRQLNTLATVQEFLMLFIDNLTIVDINSIILQATTLSQLTATTNQLTRNALSIASARCLDLSIALFNYASMISYEIVQTAVTSLAQSAGNILTAANAPLQARTMVLDLDNTRANSFPVDYDTDLESVWSNPNLFADGDDFSEETINKNRNLYYQQQTASVIIEQFDETMSMLTKSLNLHLNVEQSMSLNTSSVLMTTKKLLPNQNIQLNENIQLSLPENLQFNSIVSLRCVQTQLSIAGNPSDGHMNMSNLVLITFVDENGDEVPVNTTNNKSIEFFIQRDINLIVPSMILQNVSIITNGSTRNNAQFNLHMTNITQSNVNLSLSIHFQMHSLNESLGYMLIYKFDDIPQLNTLVNRIDGWTTLCPNNDELFTYFIDNEKSVGHQSVIFGVRELNFTEMQMYCVNMSDQIVITDRWFQFSSNYELRIFTSGCYYLDSNMNWQSNGLLVGSLTNSTGTQCFSSHLSTFASGFLVLPKPIDWNYVFTHSSFVENKTLYLTVIIITIIFFIIGISARHVDNKDNEKLEMTILSDNQSNEKYFYQIVVFTGIWKNAGTSAKVHLVISGDDYETRIRTLTNPKRKICQRGSIDSFLLAVPKSLGLLNYLRIWHDNSSDHSSWFLKYVIVRDLQTLHKHYFICQQWLSIEKGDGKIERLLPASNEEQMRELVDPLPEKAYYSLSDGHLWFSIFSGPPAANFTRVQRCTCCFVLLYTMMLLNILYYDQIQQADANRAVGGLSFGPFYFGPQQIGIGIVIDVLIFIPSILLVILFRRIRSHSSSKQSSPVVNQAFESTQTRKKRKKIFFPRWCLFLAYGISFILMIISIILIFARGIEFGERKIQTWLASLLAAFFSSVLLSQPIKVLGTAMFVALLARRSIEDENEEPNEYLDENEEYYLNADTEHIRSVPVTHLPVVNRRAVPTNHLSRSKVAEKRAIRLRNIQMWSYIRQILLYSCFLLTLYLVSYANSNANSYPQVAHVRNYFLNPNNATHNYLQISSIDKYWTWLEESFVGNIRAQSWYNGDEPYYLVGFLNDKVNRLVGWPVMRQLRIKTDGTCETLSSMRSITGRCRGDYSSSNEDHQSWFPGWNSTKTNISYAQTILNAFIYRSANELDSYEYRGSVGTYNRGGYVYEFRGPLDNMRDNLTSLHQLSWIDSYTRAVLIQMTLYNSNVQLYTSLTFLVEFLSSGDVLPQARFDPIDLHDQFQGVSSVVHGILTGVYMLFICYFTSMEIRSLIKLKMKALHSVWSFIQWGIIICSWTGLGIYIWRFKEGTHLNQLLQQTNGYTYVNIQRAVDANSILMFLLGFCCFFCSIKYLYLFRFNARLSQFARTLRYVQKDLFYFAWTFALVFLSFLSLFYLLFYSNTESCSDVFHTAEMLFEMLLLKFDTQDLVTADAFLGPLAFTLFIYFVVFICCTMIISIINDGFRYVRNENKRKTHSDEDVLMFIFLKMKQILGTKNENNPQRKEQTSLEQLADRLDHLNTTLNKLKLIPSKKSSASLINSDIYVEDL